MHIIILPGSTLFTVCVKLIGKWMLHCSVLWFEVVSVQVRFCKCHYINMHLPIIFCCDMQIRYVLSFIRLYNIISQYNVYMICVSVPFSKLHEHAYIPIVLVVAQMVVCEFHCCIKFICQCLLAKHGSSITCSLKWCIHKCIVYQQIMTTMLSHWNIYCRHMTLLILITYMYNYVTSTFIMTVQP